MTTQTESDGFLKEGDVVARPTADNPIGDRVTGLRYKGYLEYWDTKTGDSNLSPHWFRRRVEALTHEDGSPKYTFTDPQIPIDYGENLLCPLNPESPDHYKVVGKGLRSCVKGGIPNRDAMERHVRSSHKRAWTAMETDEKERIRLEDRDLQLQILKSNQDLARAMLQQNGANMAQISASQTVAVQEPAVSPASVKFGECPKCGKDFTKPTESRTIAALRGHKTHCK